MTLQVCIMTPDRIFWNEQAEQIILPTNTGQMGVLSSHAALVTSVDIGVMSVKQKNTWTFFALMNGFASVKDDKVTILVNGAEAKDEIDAAEARTSFEKAQQRIDTADGKKARIEAGFEFKRARTRFLITKD
jgi:F-type H+-transporting ATPase subunit epsilon